MKRFAAISICASLAFLCVAFMVMLVSPGSARAQGSPQVVTITVSEFQFSPSSISVARGQTIHFVVNNTGKFPHSVSFSKGPTFLTVFAQPIQGGKSGEADFTFEEAGTWTMYCPVSNHAERGMVGQARVLTGAGAPGMPSTGQPSGIPTFLAGLAAVALLTSGLVVRRRWARRVS